MSRVALNENELKGYINEIYKEEQLKILKEKWDNFSDVDKLFVVEFYKGLGTEKSKMISEATGWNTFFDLVGIIDPTGLVDLFNGISYWNQGDHLFALMTWVSVLPYVGDMIGKPVIGVMKLGGDSVKAFRVAAEAKDAVKVAEAATKAGGDIGRFVSKSPSWGPRVIELLRAASTKYPILKRFFKLIEEYVRVFTTASKEMKVVKSGGKLMKGLSRTEKESLKSAFRGFRDYGGVKNKYFKYILSKDVPLWNKMSAGFPRIFGGNPATRSLMRRTKWYLGFLDFLGIVDSKTSPEEMMKKYPNYAEKMEEYNQTEMAQRSWADDFGSGQAPKTGVEPETDDTGGKNDVLNVNPLELILGPLFK